MFEISNNILVLKYAGGAYLIYLGISMWLSRGKWF